MAASLGPNPIETELLLALDPFDNNSYPAQDLPVKSNLLVWLDAADDNVFNYSSGTEVSQWRDKSGNNFHANQSTTARQPSRSTNINSRKSLNFTSTNGDYLRVDSGMVFTNSVTAIAVIKPGTQNYAYANILDQDHGMSGGANGWVIQRNNVSSAWQSWVSNAAGDAWLNPNQVSYTDNTSQIVTVRKGSSTISLHSNGTSSGDNAISDQQIRQANYYGLNIGSWRAGGFSDRHYNGEICEILVYNRALSARELKQVHTYLGQKWGISNSDRQIFDLSGNDFNFAFNGTNPRYDNRAIISNFNTTSPYAVSSYGGQNLTSNILNLLYTDHTIEVAVNPKGFLRVVDLNAALPYEGAQGIVFWTGNHGGLYFDAYTLFYLFWNGYSSTPYLSYNVLSLKDKIIYITATRSGNVINLYVNGSLVAGPYDMGATTALPYTQINLGCAFQGNPASNGFVWAGQHEFYLVRMYQRPLTATEVSSNYSSFKNRFNTNVVKYGLILNLDAGNPFSYAGSGTTWYDTSGNANNGTIANSPTFDTSNEGIITFNGTNHRVTSFSTQISGTGSRTINCFFKVTKTARSGLCGIRDVNTLSGWVFTVNRTTTGNLTYFHTGGSIIEIAAGISTNVWYNGCVTYDSSSATAILYLNGVQIGSPVTSFSAMTSSSFNGVIGSEDNAFNDSFGGSIASIQIYNRALSAAEVLQNYNATKSRFGL